ncbi:helix-turn-helix transcriptional regulator [Alcaligenaceae bacterium]|nr:helix-turn-helix transcriptional regulator [Alcaligenaceae bacterium]
MSTFGARLREARKNIGLSQKEVAGRTGIGQSLLSELENDHYQTSGYVFQLAAVYKVSARWLAEGKGPREISAVELLDDPSMERLLKRHNQADAATQALVLHLLREANQSRPEWMTEGAASAIENARQLIKEQMRAAQLGLDVKK